jgi:hypothetical protein
MRMFTWLYLPSPCAESYHADSYRNAQFLLVDEERPQRFAFLSTLYGLYYHLEITVHFDNSSTAYLLS